jgi:hypothetical protein
MFVFLIPFLPLLLIILAILYAESSPDLSFRKVPLSKKEVQEWAQKYDFASCPELKNIDGIKLLELEKVNLNQTKSRKFWNEIQRLKIYKRFNIEEALEKFMNMDMFVESMRREYTKKPSEIEKIVTLQKTKVYSALQLFYIFTRHLVK